MTTQNLIIYNYISLYHLLEELSTDLNFKIIYLDSESLLFEKIKSLKNYLIVSNKKYPNIKNFYFLEDKPVNIFLLVEKINIEFLKLQFNNQSEVKVNNYTIDLNSRELFKNMAKLKLTEKEINVIIFLSKSSKTITVDELKKEVWKYQPGIETHTVETHIYRLRKKVLNIFDDSEFILSKKNGYQIK